jgi:5'-3' exonuclease
MEKSRFLLVDGMALLFRSYYATSVTGQFMVNGKGIPTNGVQGMLKHFFLALQTFRPTHAAVCWDMGSRTFRSELYPAYKSNRPEPPEQLIPQFDLAKTVMDALNVPNIGIEGYEADDVIGTLAKRHCRDSEILILTGDRDILQLIGGNISVALLKKGFGNYQVYSEETFIREMGIPPAALADVKALMGDPADHYPGVKGIGEKTALKLVQQFSSVQGLLENLDKVAKGVRAKIERDREMLLLCRKLAEIRCDAPVHCPLSEAKIRIDWQKASAVFLEHGFTGFGRFLRYGEASSA